MAKWNGNKVSPEQINNGNEYSVNDNLSVEALNGIVNNSINAQKNSEEALKKANSAYEANGTLVKINGENQIEWDATYSQKLYDESANIWDEVWEIGGISPDGTNYDQSTSAIRSKNYISVKPNTNYYVASSDTLYIFTYDNNKNKLGEYSRMNNTMLIPSNVEYVRFATTSSYGNVYKNDIAIIEGISGEYHPYNPNRHITNAQADLLKSEWEKQVNLYDGTTLKGNIIASTNEVDYSSVDRLISGTTYKVKPNTTYYVSFEGINRYTVYLYNSNMQYLSLQHPSWLASGVCFRTGDDAQYVRFTFSYDNNSVINSVNELKNVYFGEFGEIAYKSDISPTHVWRNGNPNTTSYAEQDISLSKPLKFGQRFRIYYKRYNNANNAIEYKDFIVNEPSTTAYYRILLATLYEGGSALNYRSFVITSYNTIHFYGGLELRLPNTLNNDNGIIIPLEIVVFEN